ncbi:MAG: nicotinamide mononucleotide transporter [Gammaproteobacteria bacterium]|jgi:hypothetical protein|nr:nicotinamide mononucleotide transporter [Gammaproteobacteria bacterium]
MGTFQDALLQYYGSDWLAMILTLIAIWLVGNKNKNGFLVHIIGNVCWIIMALMTGSLAMILANAVFILVNSRALILWSTPELAAA